MKEYKIGEEFDFEGVRIRCEESYGGLCNKCYAFEPTVKPCNIGECVSDKRFDDNNVIFVEVQNG